MRVAMQIGRRKCLTRDTQHGRTLVSTISSSSAGVMLKQCRRHWTDIKAALEEHILCADKCTVINKIRLHRNFKGKTPGQLVKSRNVTI